MDGEQKMDTDALKREFNCRNGSCKQHANLGHEGERNKKKIKRNRKNKK
jgi:hypothetical protein